MSDEEKKNGASNVVAFPGPKAAPDPAQAKANEEMQGEVEAYHKAMFDHAVEVLQAQEKISRQAAINAVSAAMQESAQLPGFYAQRFQNLDKAALWGFFAKAANGETTQQIVAPKEAARARHVNDLMGTALVIAMIESTGARSFLRAHGLSLQFFQAPIPEDKPKLII